MESRWTGRLFKCDDVLGQELPDAKGFMNRSIVMVMQPRWPNIVSSIRQFVAENIASFCTRFFVNFLFRKLAEITKETRFEGLEGIKTTVTKELRSMPEDRILSAVGVSFIL